MSLTDKLDNCFIRDMEQEAIDTNNEMYEAHKLHCDRRDITPKSFMQFTEERNQTIKNVEELRELELKNKSR